MQAMYALNFYSPIVADQLRTHRKTATIRLGDKSAKYRKGMIVQVLCGARYSPRDKVFDMTYQHPNCLGSSEGHGEGGKEEKEPCVPQEELGKKLVAEYKIQRLTDCYTCHR